MIALLSNLGNQLVTTVTTHWDVILIKGNINYFIILNDTYHHHHLYKSLSLSLLEKLDPMNKQEEENKIIWKSITWK